MAVFTLRPRRRRARRSYRRHNPRFGMHRPLIARRPGGWFRSRRSRLMRRPVRLINPGSGFSFIPALGGSSSVRRRSSRRRRSVTRFGWHRPSLRYTRKGWKRSRRSRMFRRSHIRINPRIPFGIDKMAVAAAKVGAGITIGMLGMPLIVRFAPAAIQPYRRFFGLFHVVIGAIASATIRNRAVKEAALVVAGVGAYDLIASNVTFLGLPPIPSTSTLPFLRAADGDEPGVIGLGASYQQIGADYAPAFSASYEGDDITYGGDEVEIG